MMVVVVVLCALVCVTAVTSVAAPADHDATVTDRCILALSAPGLMAVMLVG